MPDSIRTSSRTSKILTLLAGLTFSYFVSDEFALVKDQQALLEQNSEERENSRHGLGFSVHDSQTWLGAV